MRGPSTWCPRRLLLPGRDSISLKPSDFLRRQLCRHGHPLLPLTTRESHVNPGLNFTETKSHDHLRGQIMEKLEFAKTPLLRTRVRRRRTLSDFTETKHADHLTMEVAYGTIITNGTPASSRLESRGFSFNFTETKHAAHTGGHHQEDLPYRSRTAAKPDARHHGTLWISVKPSDPKKTPPHLL